MFFLPYAVDRPKRRVPYATLALLLANCIVFFVYELPYLSQGSEDIGAFGFVPNRPTLSSLLLSAFSHAGLMHLGGNMVFLWLFGSVVEDVLGPVLFLCFYLGGQIGATLLDVGMARAFAASDLALPRLGASGAIAGILGLTAVCFPRVHVKVLYLFGYLFVWRGGIARVQSWVFLGAWLAFQVFGGFCSSAVANVTGEAIGGVAYWAHVGGFGVGAVGALALALPGRIRRYDLLSGVQPSQNQEEVYQAYADLEQILRECPEDPDAWLALARAKEANGLTSDAAEAYARAAQLLVHHQQPDRALAAYEGAVYYDPSFTLPAAAQFEIAVTLTNNGDYRKALAALDNLLRYHGTSAEAEPAYARAGELAGKIGDQPAALSYFTELLRRYPDSEWRDLALSRIRSLREA